MIAKVITGKSFGGCVRYLLEREKSFVLDSAGVRDYEVKATIADLNAQRKMRPQLGNAVGHTVLSWSNEDGDKLTLEKMAEHAREYMEKMGIKNTQYLPYCIRIKNTHTYILCTIVWTITARPLATITIGTRAERYAGK
ncbi:MAG TPA: hypothetical protein DDY75_04490 [Sphingobacterium sp.]|nr:MULTISPECIES: relaxase/mobilization nuclease domain-containing protein [Sphingobacterium]HBI87130.1 hypothetical protein [Sphingobacterium sp.]